MSYNTSGRADTKESEKIFFMITKKRMKIEKLNQKMKELRVTYLKKNSILLTFTLFFFLPPFLIFLVFFSKRDKNDMCLYGW